MEVDTVFRKFVELLEHRFSSGIYTTEDSIRYTLFYCLTNNGAIHPSEFILEYPHPSVSKAKIDTYVPSEEGTIGLVFEFKFDREIPSGGNLPKPQKAGKVFGDIFRLALFDTNNNVKRYFVYVTDKEMVTYFRNPLHQLVDFFDLEHDGLKIDQEYVNRQSDTFVKSIGVDVAECVLSCCLRRDFSSGVWVRIYNIRPTRIK